MRRDAARARVRGAADPVVGDVGVVVGADAPALRHVAGVVGARVGVVAARGRGSLTLPLLTGPADHARVEPTGHAIGGVDVLTGPLNEGVVGAWVGVVAVGDEADGLAGVDATRLVLRRAKVWEARIVGAPTGAVRVEPGRAATYSLSPGTTRGARGLVLLGARVRQARVVGAAPHTVVAVPAEGVARVTHVTRVARGTRALDLSGRVVAHPVARTRARLAALVGHTGRGRGLVEADVTATHGGGARGPRGARGPVLLGARVRQARVVGAAPHPVVAVPVDVVTRATVLARVPLITPALGLSVRVVARPAVRARVRLALLVGHTVSALLVCPRGAEADRGASAHLALLAAAAHEHVAGVVRAPPVPVGLEARRDVTRLTEVSGEPLTAHTRDNAARVVARASPAARGVVAGVVQDTLALLVVVARRARAQVGRGLVADGVRDVGAWVLGAGVRDALSLALLEPRVTQAAVRGLHLDAHAASLLVARVRVTQLRLVGVCLCVGAVGVHSAGVDVRAAHVGRVPWRGVVALAPSDEEGEEEQRKRDVTKRHGGVRGSRCLTVQLDRGPTHYAQLHAGSSFHR